jgi:AbiJ-like protein
MGLVSAVVQTDEVNERLRNAIWNVIDALIPDEDEEVAVHAVVVEVFAVPVQTINSNVPKVWLLKQYQTLEWPRIYDLLEYVVGAASIWSRNRVRIDRAIALANAALQREHSGFRFIAGELTRNIHPVEAAAVEEARDRAATSGFDGVRQNIDQALALFGKRPEPDFRNAIKEAMSAVEGAVKLIQGQKTGGLAAALDALSERVEIHGALKAGLKQLYGFTSDADGIRHPILDAPKVDEGDARFMIVACSAAVNWLISKADAAGLLPKI